MCTHNINNIPFLPRAFSIKTQLLYDEWVSELIYKLCSLIENDPCNLYYFTGRTRKSNTCSNIIIMCVCHRHRRKGKSNTG